MIEIRARGVEAILERFRVLAAKYPAAAQRAVALAAVLMRAKLVARMTAPAGWDAFWGKLSPAGALLGARTGQTVRRLAASGVRQEGGGWAATVGSPDRHVLVHEEGAVVYGTSPRGYLRIPTAAAQSASGAEQQRFAGKSLRDVPGVFLIRTRSGSLWAAERRGRKRLTLLYLLRHSATQRPRGIFATVAKEMQAEFQALGLRQMGVAVTEAGL